MNNKGFAITGILYTLLILFLMILLSVLSGMRANKNMLEQSIASLEDDFEGVPLSSDKVEQVRINKMASVNGKYEFSVSFPGGDKHTCYAYLAKNTIIDENIVFTRQDCNSYSFNSSDLELKQIYSFEKE